MDDKKEKKLKRGRRLAPIAILSAMAYTLFFGTRKSPFVYSLSKIGNNFDYRLLFILWGVVTAAAFLYYIYYIFSITGFKNKRALLFLILSNLSLVLCVLIPSLRDTLPFLYTLHLLYAIASALFMLLSMMLFIAYLGKVNKQVGRRSLLAFVMIVGDSALSLVIFGVGFSEMVFVVSMGLFLLFLNLWIKKSNAKCIKEPLDTHPSQTNYQNDEKHSA